MLAIVRVRGSVNLSSHARETLKLLRLTRPNHCVLYPKNKSIEGMLHAVERFVTWGEISNDMLERLVYKRGRMPGDVRVKKENAKNIAKKLAESKDAGIKSVFRLSPPSHGYKSVKHFYPRGAVGYRGEKINELLKRMI